MINLHKCLGCGAEVVIKDWKDRNWCDICEILIPEITEYSLLSIPNKNKAEKLGNILRNPSSKINNVWKSFNNIDRREKSWFILENEQVCKRKLFDWNENENNISTIFSENDKELFTSGDQSKGNLETLRRLQRGGILPDGSHISWISGKFFLDGEVVNLPYIDLREILEKSTDYNKYNWKLMLYLISLATENTSVFDKNGFPGFLRRRPRLNTKYICKHPINNLETMKNQRLYESIKEITPFEMHQDMKYWINSWNRVLSDKSPMFVKKHEIPISLIIDKGRLMLRVKRNDKWRKIRVPRNLDIWSILINWCLMLPGDEKRNHLESLQYYLFCDLETETIAKAEINGIEFLRGIIDNSNGKASVEGKKIVVEGKYGVKYSISPGSGPHGSRFKVFTDIVSDKDMMQEEIFRRLNRRWQRGREMANMKQKELCIVEEPHLRKLVIGDAIGSIVMALLNDDKSRRKIDTLDKHLSQFDSEGEVNNREIIDRNNRQEVDQLLQRIEYEEERIGRIQERLPGDFNERRLLQLRTQLEVLQERFRFLQRVLDDTDRA